MEALDMLKLGLLPSIRSKEKSIQEKEEQLMALERELAMDKHELQQLMRQNASNVSIPWKESVISCLEIDSKQPQYFIKTPAFVAKCIAHRYGVEITRDVKNKIATTLSFLFNQGLLGRITHEGKTYYGLPQFFEDDYITIKSRYQKWIENLNQ